MTQPRQPEPIRQEQRVRALAASGSSGFARKAQADLRDLTHQALREGK